MSPDGAESFDVAKAQFLLAILGIPYDLVTGADGRPDLRLSLEGMRMFRQAAVDYEMPHIVDRIDRIRITL